MLTGNCAYFRAWMCLLFHLYIHICPTANTIENVGNSIDLVGVMYDMVTNMNKLVIYRDRSIIAVAYP